MDSNPLCLLYRPTRARTKKLSGSLPKGEILLRHVFSSHFVTPRDTSYDFLLCLLFCSSPFPRPSVFPHHVPLFIFLPIPSRRTVAYPGRTFHFTCVRYMVTFPM